MGMNGSIGPESTPSSQPPQPHWNAMTMTPYAAPIDNIFMITALRGTTKDRKTIIKRRNDRPSTAEKNTMSRLPRKSEKSMSAATGPVTSGRMVEPSTALGTISSRRAFTRSSVSASWGRSRGLDLH